VAGALALAPQVWADGLAPVSSEQSQSADSGSEAAAKLVRQLGQPSYVARRQAARQLGQLGIEAEAALSKALADANPEVRRRSSEILAEVRHADFEHRLDAFAADPDASHDYRLPSWLRFKRSLGDDRVVRELFVEMQRAEAEMLAALEGDGKAVGDAFADRCQALGEMIESRASRQTPLGTVASLLFVSSTDAVTVDESTAALLYNFILQPSFDAAVQEGAYSPLLKKLLGGWIRKNNSASLAFQNLMLAFALRLDESLELSIDVLRAKPQQAGVLQYALVGVGKFGQHEHLPLVEPYLVDTTLCEVRQIEDRQVQAQMRDIALAVSVQLTGQSLAAYGFAEPKLSDYTLFHPGMLGFASSAKRETAFAKWGRWKSSQQR